MRQKENVMLRHCIIDPGTTVGENVMKRKTVTGTTLFYLQNRDPIWQTWI